MRIFVLPSLLGLLAACGSAPTTPVPSGPTPSASGSAEPAADATPAPASDDEDEDELTPDHRPRAVLERDRMHTPWGEPLPRGATARLGSRRLHGGFSVVVAASDGTFVSGANYYAGLQKWDAASGALLASLPMPEATFNLATASADRKLGAFANYTTVTLVDLGTLKTVRSFEVFSESSGRVKGLAFLDDGTLLVGGCTKEPSLALRVFDRAGSVQRSLSVPRPKQSYDEACAGPLVAHAGWIGAAINDKARLIPQKSGESRGELEAGASVQALALSSDGSRFYVGAYGGVVNAFDTQTLKAVRSFGFFSYDSDRAIQGLALSPDGSTLAVSASKVRLYDVRTGLERMRLEARAEGGFLMGHSFASQGDALAFPLHSPALVGRFDWKTGVQRGPHDLGRHDDVVEHVLVAQGGTLVSSSRDGTLRAWRPDGSPVATQRSVGGSASIALGASGTLLATGVASRSVAGSDSPLCAVTVHDASTLALRDTIELGDGEDSDCWASDLVTSAGGSVAYAVFDKRLVAFDPATKSVLAKIPAEGRRSALVALSDGTLALRREGRWEVRDGSSLASRRVLDLPEAPFAAARGAMVGAQRVSDEQLAMLDLRTGKTTRTVDAPKGTRFSFDGAVALSPDGQLAYAGTVGDGVSGLVAFSVATGKLLGSLERLHDLGHPRPVSLDLSPDGATLIEGNSDGTALVIDPRSFGGVK